MTNNSIEHSIEQIHIYYEIAMSIGKSMDLDKMLRESFSVFLHELNCIAGGVFLYVRPGQLQPKLRSFLIPRIYSGTKEYSWISETIDNLIKQRITSDDSKLISPIKYKLESTYILIMEMPETGFIFFCNENREFDTELIETLRELNSRLASACLACYQNDALIQSQYDLELRIAHRTQEIESRNDELRAAYDKLQKAQKQLIHSEKMVSLGQLAAGVAHEINNPTGFISSNLHTMSEYFNSIETFYELVLDLLKKMPAENSSQFKDSIESLNSFIQKEDLSFIVKDGEELINESIDGAERIKEIVTGLRNFGRTDDSDFSAGNINDAIETALRLTRNIIKYKCEISKELNELPDIPCKLDQLTQVFVNILVNASQAIEAHGLIQIRSFLENNFITVIITDNGKGIPEDNLTKLFDPFFTTKEIGKGTGLGLSISHGIIEKHSGNISVESEVDVGTSFTIRFPVENH